MQHLRRKCSQSSFPMLFLAMLLMLLAACGNGSSSNSSASSAGKQVLRFPNVGISDIARLDPASGPDANSNQAINMIFSGLVKLDKNLNVLPDQATWDISDNNKVYTFHLKPGITFSDGTPVTAQSYVYTWTRALLPEVRSPIAAVLMNTIVGANDVATGKTRTLAGVKALDPQTLQVTLVQPTAYFLQLVGVSLFYPLNQKLIEQYGQLTWTQHAAGNGAGTGPFMIKLWQTGVKMVLVPNPHYYGAKTKLSEVDMTFVKDPATAFEAYQAGQYDFVWNLTPQDQQVAKNLPGFTRQAILESDLLFFDNRSAPFNKTAVRQAFAAAINKQELAHAILKDTVTPASTIIPPGEPGSQPDYPGIPFNPARAKQLLQSVYPNVSQMPSVTFSYPTSQVSQDEVGALQQMWQQALGVQVKLNGMDLATYNDETTKHDVQFGFTQWGVYFPDPYEWLDLSLLSNSPNNNGDWSNPDFDKTVALAEQKTGNERLALYQQAERIAIDNVGWLPLDHESQAAVISPKVHGLTLNGQGLYFGDWSGIYLTQ
jgi:oligopeptide transport system substrate-binding protein